MLSLFLDEWKYNMNNSGINDELPFNQEIVSPLYLKCQNFEASENVSQEKLDEIVNFNNFRLTDDFSKNQNVENTSFNIKIQNFQTSENISRVKLEEICDDVECNLLTYKCQNRENNENIESPSFSSKCQKSEKYENVTLENLEDIGNVNNSKLMDISKNEEVECSSFNITDQSFQTHSCQNIEESKTTVSASFILKYQKFKVSENDPYKKLEAIDPIDNSEIIDDMMKNQDVASSSFNFKNKTFQARENTSHENLNEISCEEELVESNLLTDACQNVEKNETFLEENPENRNSSKISDLRSNLFDEPVILIKKMESASKEFQNTDSSTEIVESNLLSDNYQNLDKCKQVFEEKPENIKSSTEFGTTSKLLDRNTELNNERDLYENKYFQLSTNVEFVESNILSDRCQNIKKCDIFLEEEYKKVENFRESDPASKLLDENDNRKNDSVKNCTKLDRNSNLLDKQFILNNESTLSENEDFQKSDKTVKLSESNIQFEGCQYKEKSDTILREKHGNDELDLASSLLDKNINLNTKSQLHKRTDFQTTEMNAEKAAELIRNRLLEIHTPLIVCENILKEFLQVTRSKLHLASAFSSEVETVLQIKLLQAELMYRLIKKTTADMVPLVEDNYDFFCKKDSGLFKTVMSRCDEIDQEIHIIIIALLDL